MSSKTPVRVVFDGSNNATGLAEFQSGEFIPLSAGGIGASLSIGSAGQVLKVNSGASALEFGNVEAILNIDGLTDGSGITIADGDDFAISDAGTEKKVNASQISTYVQGTISGDITISGGTAAIGSGVIVNADINSSAAIADSKLDTISTAGKVALSALEIDGGTDIGADLVDADEIIVDDGGGGTNRRSDLERVKKYIFSAVSGDATASDAGALTIANTSVETAMLANDAVTEAKIADDAVESEHLNDNIISGQTALTSGLATTDELLISDGGTLKKMDVSLILDSAADEATALAIALG